MRRLNMVLLALAVTCLGATFAWAQDESAEMLALPALDSAPVAVAEEAPAAVPAADAVPGAPNAYGYNADDVAVSQGVVLYWYAHGYANAYGNIPAKFEDLVAKGLPLRKFLSPHTGDEIMPDDGTLDFDGDMTYKGDCRDATIQVQTTKGVVTLPGSVSVTSDISGQFGPCCNPNLCGTCWDITICGFENWNICDPSEAACKIVGWMMWKSFELHEKLYGTRPADELAWMASGLAPIDKNYKEYVPTMDIEYIYSKGECCVLKKAKVTCCAPCVPVSPCKSACGSKCSDNAPCGKSTCNSCKSKCAPANPCGKSTCNKCASKSSCKPSCAPEKPCGKSTCNSCKSKCAPEKPCGKSTCNSCKSKSTCNSCKSKCAPEKPCGKCNKCQQNTCSKCKPEKKCNTCSWKADDKPGCSTCH